MKAYEERTCLFGILTLVSLDDLGVTQGQSQKYQIFTAQAFIIT